MKQLPYFLYPLVQNVKLTGEVSLVAKIQSYEMFVESYKQRMTGLKAKTKTSMITSDENKLWGYLTQEQVIVADHLPISHPLTQRLAEKYFSKVMFIYPDIKKDRIKSYSFCLRT